MISFSASLPHWLYRVLDRKLGRQGWFSFYRHGKINEDRSWEVQLDHFGFSTLLSFELNCSLRGSHHAGPAFEITLLGFMFRVEAPSNHHWDYENDCWEA